jgi:hypothetical protein
MSKNAKLLYCILGSAILALSNNPMFERTINSIKDPQSGSGYILGNFLIGLSNLLSLIGIISLIVFSIILVVWNIKFKDK